MKHWIRYLLANLLTIVAVSTSVTAGAQTPAVSANKVRIHHVGVLSKGPLVPTNKEALASAQAYLAQVNRDGGVAGRQIELVLLDDQQEPTLADTLSREVVERNEVLAFFLPRTSPANQMLLKNAQPAGVPIIAPQVGPNFMYTRDQRSFFTIRASYEAELVRAIDLQLKFDRKSFAFLAADDSYGNPLVEAAAKKLAPLSIRPMVSKVDNRAADINPALTSFIQSRPEVIFLLCSASCASDFVKKYKERGATAQFITLSNNSSNSFLKALGDAGRGVIVMQVMPLPTTKTVKLSRDYQALCAEAKLSPSYNGLVAYVGARVLVESLKRAGKNLNTETLRTALVSMNQFDLGDFVIAFNASDYNGTDFVEETIISRDGTFLR